MRTIGAPTVTEASTASGIIARLYVWFAARDRTTGATQTLGLWSGADVITETINGEARTYYGAGSLLAVDPITYTAGRAVQMHWISVSSVSPEVEQLVRGYEPRLAPVEVHRGLVNAVSNALVEAPHRLLLGNIDSISFTTPADGESATCEITVANSSRDLTRPLTAKYSNETMRIMAANDGFFQYGDVSGEVSTRWGG
jgi:hypothetical protein